MRWYDAGTDRLATLETVLRFGRKFSAAIGACQREPGSALQAEFCLQRILMLTARTLHVGASTCLISELKSGRPNLAQGD